MSEKSKTKEGQENNQNLEIDLSISDAELEQILKEEKEEDGSYSKKNKKSKKRRVRNNEENEIITEITTPAPTENNSSEDELSEALSELAETSQKKTPTQIKEIMSPQVTVGKKEKAGIKQAQFEEVPDGDILYDELFDNNSTDEPNPQAEKSAVVEMSPEQKKLYKQRKHLFEKAEELKEKAIQEKEEVKKRTSVGKLHEIFGSTTLEELQNVVSEVEENTREIEKIESIDMQPIIETTENDAPKKSTESGLGTTEQSKFIKPEFVGTARQFGVKNTDDLAEKQKDFDETITSFEKSNQEPKKETDRLEEKTGIKIEKPSLSSKHDRLLEILKANSKIEPNKKLNSIEVTTLVDVGIEVDENMTREEASEKLQKAGSIEPKDSLSEIEVEIKTLKTLDTNEEKSDEQEILANDLANIESLNTEEILGSLVEKQTKILEEADRIDERGFIERKADEYNKMSPLKKIGMSTVLIGGGLALGASGGLATLGGLALITASRGIGGMGKFAKYKKMLESEDGRGGLNEQAGRLQKFFNKIDGFVVDGMRRTEWVKKHPRIAASVVGWAHFGMFTGGFVQIAEYLENTEWVKDVYDKVEFPKEDISILQETQEIGTTGDVEIIGSEQAEGIVTPEELTGAVPNEAVTEIKPFSMKVPKDEGAIKAFEVFKQKLEAFYPGGERPDVVEKLLNKSPIELAKEYGYYKPGQEAESAMLMDGDHFSMDVKGNFVHEMQSGEDLILESSGKVLGDGATEAGSNYDGVMFDHQAPNPTEQVVREDIVTETNSASTTQAVERPTQKIYQEQVNLNSPLQSAEATEINTVQELSPAQREYIEKLVEERAGEEMKSLVNEMFGSKGAIGFFRSIGENGLGENSRVWQSMSNYNANYVLTYPKFNNGLEEFKFETPRMASKLKHIVEEVSKIEGFQIRPEKNERLAEFILRLFKIKAQNSIPNLN